MESTKTIELKTDHTQEINIIETDDELIESKQMTKSPSKKKEQCEGAFCSYELFPMKKSIMRRISKDCLNTAK